MLRSAVQKKLFVLAVPVAVFLIGAVTLSLRGEETLEFHSKLLNQRVAEYNRFGEVVARIHMHQRKWDRRGMERLTCEVDHNNGVLPAGKQKNRALKLSGHFAHQVYRLCLKILEVGSAVQHV